MNTWLLVSAYLWLVGTAMVYRAIRSGAILRGRRPHGYWHSYLLFMAMTWPVTLPPMILCSWYYMARKDHRRRTGK